MLEGAVGKQPPPIERQITYVDKVRQRTCLPRLLWTDPEAAGRRMVFLRWSFCDVCDVCDAFPWSLSVLHLP